VGAVATMGPYVFHSSRFQHLLLVPFVAFLSTAFALALFAFLLLVVGAVGRRWFVGIMYVYFCLNFEFFGSFFQLPKLLLHLENYFLKMPDMYALTDSGVLNQLRGRQAEIFMLREIDGLSTEEICNELNIIATNSWVMLYRARMGLRRCLEENWIDDSN
jgi:hypothetical protein